MGKIKYWSPERIEYYSKRYDKFVIIEKGYGSDGATFAEDIYSRSWWVHDKLCDEGTWADGTPVTNWQASMVLRDILLDEGRYVRACRWFVWTFLVGGRRLKKENGWFKLKEKK